MIDVNSATGEAEKKVLALIRSMETGRLAEELPRLCSPAFTWANSGLPTLKGQEAVFALMAKGGFSSQIPILGGMTHFSADLLHIASNGNVVFTERVDHHWDADGRDLMTPHICGVAEVEDGLITAFRDFYDVCCYTQAPTAVQEGFDLSTFRARQDAGQA